MITFATVWSGVAQGLMWAVLTMGVYLTFRVLSISDLTVEGSFTLGAAVCVVLINKGVNPFAAVLCAFASGMLAGLVTGVLHTVFKIPAILSGILTMIALYSVNIRIMSDKATVTIAGTSVKTVVASLLAGQKPNTLAVVAGASLCLILIALLYLFFGTELGCAIRATGSNEKMARSMSINTDLMKITGLMISNGLVALSGCFIAQFDYGSALVNMGQGAIVIGLASVIIGEVIFIHKELNFAVRLLAITAGSVIYRTIIACALTIPWMKATDLKLITAMIVAVALALPVFKEQMTYKRLQKSHGGPQC